MARAEYIRSIFNYGAEILVDGRTGLPVGHSKNGVDQYFARFAVDGTSLVDGAGNGVPIVVRQPFIIGGQSNADGRGLIDAGAEKPHPQVSLYTKGGLVVPCNEPASVQDSGWVNNIPVGLSPSTPAHSFITSAGKSVMQLTGIQPIMVPCAIGSTTMTHWLPPVTQYDIGSLFGAMMRRAADVSSFGLVPVFVWAGHESNFADTAVDLALGTITNGYMALWRAQVDNIRAYYPTAPIIYCQLSTHSDITYYPQFQVTGEAQRRADALSTDTAIVTYAASVLPAPSQYSLNTDGTNAINFGTNGPLSFTMAGDGGTVLQGGIIQLTPGAAYRVTVNVTGTGNWKCWGDNAQIGLNNRGTGTIVLDYVAGGAGRLVMYREASGQATNLTFTITSVQIGLIAKDANSYMVVTHDLPRNAAADGVHVSAAGQRELGRRIALCYADRVLGMRGVNGTGPRFVSATKSGATVRIRYTKTVQADANGYGAALATSLFRVYDGGVEATLISCARDTPDTDILITCSATLTGVIVVTYGNRAGPATEIYRPGVVYDTDGLPAPQMMVTAT